jgi:hypothetical protein
MGQATYTHLVFQGTIGAVQQTLFLRGLTAPSAHLAWSGLSAGALFAFAAAPSVAAAPRL